MDEFVPFLDEVGVLPRWQAWQGEGIQREMVAFFQDVMLSGMKTLLGMEAMHALPDLVGSDDAAMRLAGCNAVQLRDGICQRRHDKRQGAKTLGPLCPDPLADNIVQLSTGTYKSPDLLPDGAVVVVGGGQSGAQIVEDLRGAGRIVYFSISKAPRLPRRYRGRDFMDWWLEMGLWDVETNDVDDPAVLATTNPLVSGVGRFGHTVSYQQLARDGVRLMGRLEDVVGGEIITDDRVVEYVRNADAKSEELRDKIDVFIEEQGLTATHPDPDPADRSLAEDEHVDYLTRLNLQEAGVGTIIWSTGFTADFSWIDLPVTDMNGKPVHNNGESPAPGIYFIGFPWLSKRKSGVVFGVDEDARHISNLILQRSQHPAE